MRNRCFLYPLILIALISFISFTGHARDEGIPGGFAGDGVIMGNFVLYPGMELIYQFEDNVFLEPDDGDAVSSSQYMVRPKLQLEMPFWNSYIRMGYAPQYRWYQQDGIELDTNWSHVFQLDSFFRTGAGLDITVRDRFVKGVLETEEFDEFREVIRGRDSFTANTAEVGLRYTLTPRLDIGVGSEFKTVDFDEVREDPSAVPTFFDFQRLQINGIMRYRIMPLTYYSLTVAATSTEQERTGVDNGFNSWIVRMGLRGSLTRTLSGSISAGYEGTDFDLSNYTEYSGLIADFRVQNTFSNNSKLELTLNRRPNQSAFGKNNYYSSNQASITYTHRLSNIVFYSLGLAFQNNDYPEQTFVRGDYIERDDDISSIKVGMGLYLHERASLRVNYRYEDRDSNISYFDYTNNVYMLEANIGW